MSGSFDRKMVSFSDGMEPILIREKSFCVKGLCLSVCVVRVNKLFPEVRRKGKRR